MVIESIAADPNLMRLVERMRSETGAVFATGLWGSSAPMLAAAIAEAAGRPILYVTSHFDEADNAREDIEFFLGRGCDLFPAWETLPGEGAAAGEIDAERLRLCSLLASGGDDPGRPGLIVCPVLALMQPVPTPAALAANALHIAVGRPANSEAIAAWLVERGFTRLDLVESPGDFALRGGIFDIFARGDDEPVRIELFDDQVESIRRFDVSSQRSTETLREVTLAALPEGKLAGQQLTEFLAYLPRNAIIALDEPAEVQEMGRTLRRRLGDPRELYPVETVLRRVNDFTQIHLARLVGAPTGRGEDVHKFDVASLARFEGKSTEVIQTLCEQAVGSRVIVVCDNEGERSRLAELIREAKGDVPRNIELRVGLLHQGFEWRTARTIVVGHHELFQRQRQRRRLRRFHAARPLETWAELQPGDLVVHAQHGIARFKGLELVRKGDSAKQEEFLTLEFDEKAVLRVPSSQIDLVQKYIGAAGVKPRLSRLGGTRWRRTKEKVTGAVSDLAESLLRIQAARRLNEGTAYPADTQWQREFEAAFEYEETEDQLVTTEQVKHDLCAPRPMDRLLCGDVGYGKTEIALRAAFKVVEYGRQVVVLVPTTVLAEQHYQTFCERLADYPMSVSCLSRFRTKAEQADIVSAARKGQVDVVIGTHRLLSKDVGFADLGLVVIDEEQRFGVEHKERLKRFRETVDVLTMTATPIPRTLHLSLLGIRDISALETPPVDRRSIATQVCAFDSNRIRQAVVREMNRDGQVFFVHNVVQSIDRVADEVRRIVPEARILVGHGQMREGALEKVMTAFMRHDADVLVCTTIIESGIDIPAANTIFIDRADRFGLADLHQLRGRVGRSKHQAYCYLLLSPDRPVTSKAARRLKAIEEFSELGAGFRIAMRDLEIRGAGNILGPEQSGHIAAVGYEMYCSLLESAVRRLKDEPDLRPTPVHVELDIAAHIPPHYIRAERSRIEIYRRMTACRTVEELEQLRTDLEDAFGPYPDPVSRLLELAEIRVLARRWRIRSIILREPDVVFSVENVGLADRLFADAPGTARMPDAHTVHLRMPPAYLEPQTLPAILRKILGRPAPETSS
jgi:transcription-repair coupling factor (superfamily II helicase)